MVDLHYAGTALVYAVAFVLLLTEAVNSRSLSPDVHKRSAEVLLYNGDRGAGSISKRSQFGAFANDLLKRQSSNDKTTTEEILATAKKLLQEALRSRGKSLMAPSSYPPSTAAHLTMSENSPRSHGNRLADGMGLTAGTVRESVRLAADKVTQLDGKSAVGASPAQVSSPSSVSLLERPVLESMYEDLVDDWLDAQREKGSLPEDSDEDEPVQVSLWGKQKLPLGSTTGSVKHNNKDNSLASWKSGSSSSSSAGASDMKTMETKPKPVSDTSTSVKFSSLEDNYLNLLKEAIDHPEETELRTELLSLIYLDELYNQEMELAQENHVAEPRQAKDSGRKPQLSRKKRDVGGGMFEDDSDEVCLQQSELEQLLHRLIFLEKERTNYKVFLRMVTPEK